MKIKCTKKSAFEARAENQKRRLKRTADEIIAAADAKTLSNREIFEI